MSNLCMYTKCPVCRDGDGMSWRVSGAVVKGGIDIDCRCNICGANWVEHYKYDGILFAQDGTGVEVDILENKDVVG